MLLFCSRLMARQLITRPCEIQVQQFFRPIAEPDIQIATVVFIAAIDENVFREHTVSRFPDQFHIIPPQIECRFLQFALDLLHRVIDNFQVRALQFERAFFK